MGDTTPHGKSPGRRVSRPTSKPLKRRSLVTGDSNAPRVVTSTADNKDKEMAASFLQYCAMCEKQITTPSNSILYCSEACRRKDTAKPLSASNLTSPYNEYSPSLSRPTLPSRMSSTSPDYFTSTSRIPSDIHHHKSDLDPTEWKPKLAHRGASEAFRYLSRFHQTMMDGDAAPQHVHRHKSSASASLSMMTTPSLGNTPTTTSSSFDSAYYGLSSFSFSTRPLPPRQNPMYSTSANGKGIDLVTPHIAPSLDATVAMSVPGTIIFDEDLWGKKVIVPGSTPRSGDGKGLGALFCKEE
ncbi:life-span regulatory factor-domain-containing protein [Exophiala viscosa]|uniref:Life-span regulatory factor-domain-containing protein n=1 Tax=Exophiala viscosa TaxID=2486360 RepID=A0AAN6DPL9_9EURO|nr:life-span regulatory factor-domain-containing protein [Exophiala viscosa]